MRVLIINGSPRKNGVTAAVLHRIEENLRGAGIEVLFYNLEEMKMSHCTGCNYCYRIGHCCMEDDAELLSKRIEEADGIVLGSPTYASNVSGLMKDFIDRGHFVMEQLLYKKYCIKRFRPPLQFFWRVALHHPPYSNVLFYSNSYSRYNGTFSFPPDCKIALLYLLSEDFLQSYEAPLPLSLFFSDSH